MKTFPEGRRYRRFLFSLLSIIVSPFFFLWIGFKRTHGLKPLSPALILCNHVTDLDPMIVGFDLPGHMYFVASDHLRRARFGELLAWVFDPIYRVKGRTESQCAMDILRRLRKGDSVCVFIEGDRTYDGRTAEFGDGAAHLAQMSGASLRLYRMTGGYLTHPRWAAHYHRGHMHGEVVRDYSPAELKAMSREELQQKIRAALFVDADADQEKLHCRYRGKDLAEHLETALFICPCCGRIATLHSKGDRFFCDCGLDLRYTEYGCFEAVSGNAPYRTVAQWYAWQKEKIKEICLAAQNTQDRVLFFEDKDQLIQEDLGHGKAVTRGNCTLRFYDDALDFLWENGAVETVPKDQLTFSCIQQRLLRITLKDGRSFEVRSEYPRSAVKYQLFHKYL